jgi:hypothetical protein
MVHKCCIVMTALGLVTFLFAAMPSGYQGTIFTGDTLKGHPQHLPGDIHMVYFDEGADGVAFHYMFTFQGDCMVRTGHTGTTVPMQGFQAWRDFLSGPVGGVNDTDVKHSSCYLGWTENKNGDWEWMNYTVHVDTAGAYGLQIHESVAKYPNLIRVTFSGVATDSVVNTELSINSPGDLEIWHDWKWDDTPNKIVLDTGMYVLNVNLDVGNWNLACMRFKLVSPAGGVVTPRVISPVPAQLSARLVGNDLVVSYVLNEAGRATISVFDCTGRMVIPAATGSASSGCHTQTLNLKMCGPGVHFLKIEQNGISRVKSFYVTR